MVTNTAKSITSKSDVRFKCIVPTLPFHESLLFQPLIISKIAINNSIPKDGLESGRFGLEFGWFELESGNPC